MADAMKLRGPDDEGYVAIDMLTRKATELGGAASVKSLPKRIDDHSSPHPTLYLGHRRLSIIDLSPAGHQPMSCATGKIWIIFNGEIYNFRELRAELSGGGDSFRSQSDTEVLLHGYARWGIRRLLAKIRGMYAFAIVDMRERAREPKLLLARDRLGIKPLYYRDAPGSFMFASETRAITAGTGEALGRDAAIAFLLFGYIPDPLTASSGVSALPAGHYLTYERGRTSLHRYYDCLEPHLAPRLSSRDGFGPPLRRRLERAVVSHLVSDAPLGVFLSGGLDSSSIAALASRTLAACLRTLSWDVGGRVLSERARQRLVAGYLETRHREFTVSPERFLAAVDGVLSAQDQPSIDGVNTYFVCRYARKLGLKAVLSGLGADEIFHGYGGFDLIELLSRVQQQPSSRRGSVLRGVDARYGEFLSAGDPVSLYLSCRALFRPSEIQRLLGVSRGEVGGVITGLLDASIMQARRRLKPRDFYSYMETRFYLRGQLLRDTDAMGMRHSVEVRVPFLDHQLYEWAARVPAEAKSVGGRRKVPLRDGMSGLLPREIVEAEKQGFELPFRGWLRAAGPDIMSGARSHPSLDRTEVTRVWRGFLTGKSDWKRAWGLVALSRFPRSR